MVLLDVQVDFAVKGPLLLFVVLGVQLNSECYFDVSLRDSIGNSFSIMIEME